MRTYLVGTIIIAVSANVMLGLYTLGVDKNVTLGITLTGVVVGFMLQFVSLKRVSQKFNAIARQIETMFAEKRERR